MGPAGAVYFVAAATVFNVGLLLLLLRRPLDHPGMSRPARLTAPPAGDPSARVAGMTVLLRQLLSLQDAGVSGVTVELPAEQLPTDPRLRIPVQASAGSQPADLSAPLGLVWHRGLPARLAAAGFTGEIHPGAAPSR